MVKRDLVVNGIRIGEYDFIPENVINEIKEKCIDNNMNYVAFSVNPKANVKAEDFEKWAKYLAENKIYFSFSSADGTMKFDKVTGLKMKEIAGEYYLMNAASEIGTVLGCCGKDYGRKEKEISSLSEGKQNLKEAVRAALEKASFGGALPASVDEATGLLPYVAECGVAFPQLETMCGNPEIMIPMLRGTAKAIKSNMFATYIAHEWYAGTRNFDILKRKRLETVYNYAYMSGSNLFVLESGDLFLHSHDVHNYETYTTDDTQVCENYRRVIKDFADFVKKDERPAGGPRVKVAFVKGNLDGHSPWRACSSIWNSWSKKEYGYGTAEFTWRIFDDIASKRCWSDVHNFGEHDYSGAAAYGMYDIIPATADADVMSEYDYLIFTGWNTMTDEIYENLKKYVTGGGRLLISAAHLNTNDKRDGKINLIHGGNVEDLFGCTLGSENAICVNDGYKFEESIMPGVYLPASMEFDPLFSEGYVNYAETKLCGGKRTGILSQAFIEKNICENAVSVVENKVGEGYTMLMTALDYPGGALYPVYRMLVRELMQASHREADIKIFCNDKVRSAVYETDKIYLLNTDFDCNSYVKIDYGSEVKELTLAPCEFKVIEGRK